MRKLLLYFLFLSSTALAQSPYYGNVVRTSTLSPARVANAVDVSKPLTSSGTDTYTFPVPFSGFTYHTGDIYTFVFSNTNTSTTVTANINSLGALSIKDASGSDLAINDLKAGGAYKFYNNGTHLRMIGGAGGGGGTIDGSGTTNEISYWVDSNTLGSLAVATYPSLTELSYVKGITSAAQTQLNAKQATTNSAVALTDAASIDITGIKHTLATSSGTRTFTISYTGDEWTIELTLSATGTVLTFPATSLTVSEGVASGNNTATLAGVSGDKYIVAGKKMGSNYYVVVKNFGQ